MIVICLEGCHGCGKTSLSEAFKKNGFAILDECFMDMPKVALKPQSLVMESIWVSNWFQRLLKKQYADTSAPQDSEDPEEKLYIADRSPYSAVFYTEDHQGRHLQPLIREQINELRAESGIRIYTVYIRVNPDILWDRIQARLLREPHRAQYHENEKQWMNQVLDFYEHQAWDFVADNNFNSIDDLMKTIIDEFNNSVHRFKEASPRSIRSMALTPLSSRPSIRRTGPASPLKPAKRLKVEKQMQQENQTLEATEMAPATVS